MKGITAKRVRVRKTALSAGISMLVLAWCGAAFAQDAATAAGNAPDKAKQEEAKDLDKVVVTAERRDKPLQVTPISASVLSGEDLGKWGVSVVDQLQFATPAAVVNNFGQGVDFNIRGIGKAEHNTQTTTGVITYRDGVATFPGYFTAEPYYDIASVEVLRGPQGTFEGQNATGGAVYVTSNDPVIGGGYHGYVQGQAGNYNDLGAQGAINLPISDTLAARFSLNAENHDSFWKVGGPRPDQDADTHLLSARFGLLWKPTDALSVLWKTDYNNLDFGAYPADPVNSTNDIFHVTNNADQLAHDKFIRSVLKVDYVWDNGVRFRSVTGDQNGTSAYRTDLDGTGTGNWTFRDVADEHLVSQEVSLISPDEDRFTWVVGAYWQKDTHVFPPGQFVIGVPEGSPFSEYVLEGTNPLTAKAVYGQVGFKFTDKFEMDIGGRYTKSKTSNDVSVVQYGTPINDEQSAEFSNFSGKVSLNYTLDARNFLYAFYATGFRPGGLNVPVVPGMALQPFDEEKVKSSEAGWKAVWADGRIRTQVDAFHNEYEGFQVSISYPDNPVFGIELNDQDATTIDGFEAQVQAYLGSWMFDAGLGSIHSKLGRFYATDQRLVSELLNLGIVLPPCDPNAGPASYGCTDLEGRQQTYAPNLTWNLGVQREFEVGKGTITPRFNYSHVGDQWATLFEDEARGDRIEARNILTGQIAWQTGDYVVTLYGTNLTDKHYVAAVNSGLRFAGSPRQYGLRIMKTF